MIVNNAVKSVNYLSIHQNSASMSVSLKGLINNVKINGATNPAILQHCIKVIIIEMGSWQGRHIPQMVFSATTNIEDQVPNEM